jgi:hypothetical protein
MIPKIEDHALPDEHSVLCKNASLERGSIGPIKGVTLVTDFGEGVGPYRTLYKMGPLYLCWDGTRDVVKAEIAESDHRIYWTSGSLDHPKQTNSTKATIGVEARFGVRSPVTEYPTTSALVVAPQGTGDGEVVQSVSYIYTYVDEFGSESAPSAPTAVYDIQTGQYVKLSNFKVPTYAVCGSNISYIRVYRLEDDGTGTAEYMLVSVHPVNLSAAEVSDVSAALITSTDIAVYDANATVDPTGLTTNVAESLPSETWEFLPATATNLVQWQNGILAATVDNEIYISEPAIHYAWPLGYRMMTQHDVVGLGVYRETLIALTKGYPYMLLGSDPENTVLERLPFQQACLSKRGILNTDFGVLYPSPDGIYLVDASSGRIATEHLITKEQWNTSYTPSELLAFAYDDEAYFWRSGYSTGFILDLVNRDSLRQIDLGTNYGLWHAFYDAENDILYMLVLNSNTETYQVISAFTNSTLMPFLWTSKLYRYPSPVSMSTARVWAEFSDGVTFQVYADGVLKFSTVVTDNKPFRLPGGFRAKTWQVSMSSTDTVNAYQVATSTDELLRIPINASNSTSGSFST